MKYDLHSSRGKEYPAASPNTGYAPSLNKHRLRRTSWVLAPQAVRLLCETRAGLVCTQYIHIRLIPVMCLQISFSHGVDRVDQALSLTRRAAFTAGFRLKELAPIRTMTYHCDLLCVDR